MKSNQQTFHLIGKKFETEDLLRIFATETPYQVDRLADYLRRFTDKPFKLVVSPTKRAKTKEALGMYFGALVPATTLDVLGLSYNPDEVYEDYKYYRQRGKVAQKHYDAADNMLRLEWHYAYTRRIDGTLYRTPKDLSTRDGHELRALIEKVMEWRIENAYPYIDIEKYKTMRDSARLSTE